VEFALRTQWNERRVRRCVKLVTALALVGSMTVAPRGAIPAEVKGLGWFPNPHHPRVFWAGVHGGESFSLLAKDIDVALRRCAARCALRPISASAC